MVTFQCSKSISGLIASIHGHPNRISSRFHLHNIKFPQHNSSVNLHIEQTEIGDFTDDFSIGDTGVLRFRKGIRRDIVFLGKAKG